MITYADVCAVLDVKNGKAKCPAHDDSTPSLSVTDRIGLAPLLKCHAGCQFKDIVIAIERLLGHNGNRQKMHHDEPQRIKSIAVAPSAPKPPALIWAQADRVEYVYRNWQTGQPEARKLRYPNKRFGWEKFTSLGWVKSTGGLPTSSLYRVHEVIAKNATGHAKAVLFVEGEKDVDNAWEAGINAVCNPDGAAGKFKPEYLEQIGPNLAIYVVADKDPVNEKGKSPGRDHAKDFAQKFAQAGREVYVVELPGDDVKDLSDWLAAGHVKDDLVNVLEDPEHCRKIEPATSLNPVVQLGAYIDTDKCNAKRLIARHGQDLRYLKDEKEWRVWSGKVWQEGELAALRKASQTASSIREELEGLDEDLRKRIEKWAVKSEQIRGIKAMVEAASIEESIEAMSSQFDRIPHIINVENGIVDLRTGELLPHDRAMLCSRMVQVRYVPGATDETWNSFLSTIFKDNQEMLDYIQLAQGYSITGSTAVAAFFFCYGKGHNGKTTLVEAIKRLLGDYADSMQKKSIMHKEFEPDHTSAVAKLDGIRYVQVAEIGNGVRLDEDLVKYLTGGDSLTARAAYGRKENTFEPTHHLWGTGNDLPNITNDDDGIWRRMHLIPFTHHFDKPDTRIRDHFYEDQGAREAIFNWLVQGAVKYYANGQKIDKPELVSNATTEYKEEMDTVAHWIQTKCESNPGGEFPFAKIGELYKSYADYMRECGQYPFKLAKFSRMLSERGYEKDRVTKGERIMRGISVRC